jgi:hypothetical protein
MSDRTHGEGSSSHENVESIVADALSTNTIGAKTLEVVLHMSNKVAYLEGGQRGINTALDNVLTRLERGAAEIHDTAKDVAEQGARIDSLASDVTEMKAACPMRHAKISEQLRKIGLEFETDSITAEIQIRKLAQQAAEREAAEKASALVDTKWTSRLMWVLGFMVAVSGAFKLGDCVGARMKQGSPPASAMVPSPKDASLSAQTMKRQGTSQP